MKKEKKLPRISLCVLGLIILSSVFAGVLAPYSMEEMNPAAINLAPSAAICCPISCHPSCSWW